VQLFARTALSTVDLRSKRATSDTNRGSCAVVVIRPPALSFTTATSRNWRDAISCTVEEPFQGVLTQAIRFGPLFLIGMFLYGSVDANDDLTRTNDPYLFTFKGEPAPKLEIFLRNFDRGALVRDAVSQRVEFRKWDEISSISLVVATPTRTPWCWATGWLCGAAPQAIIP
jgi:hypothetical protein